MEPSEVYQAKLKKLKSAIEGFVLSLEQNLNGFDAVLLDTLRSGQVQKFEYSAEYLWKFIKLHLFEKEGIDVNSPKRAIKTFHLVKNLDDDLYHSLLKIIHHRNLFSHIYNEKQFEELFAHLPLHAKAMKQVLSILSKEI